MKSILKSVFVSVCLLAMAAPLYGQVTTAGAGGVTTFVHFNPPPCDFNDEFYKENGVDPGQLVGRFGNARQFGLPSLDPNQPNWVADSTCATNDPTRRNIRILATTGGFRFEDGSPTEFISIIAFVTSQNAFLSSFTKQVGGSTISIVNGANPRGIHMQDIVSNFEGYAAIKQVQPGGRFALNPCAADMQAPGIPTNPCFDVSSVNTVFTPNLRQNWNFTTGRNAIDGSDHNCLNPDPTVCGDGVNDAPFGYFCDDLLGMWIITYHWYIVNPLTEPSTTACGQAFAALAKANGTSLDGTPIIVKGDELDGLEGIGCAAEANEAANGADGGAVWLICPAIQDPRNGGIATDAFLDGVRLKSGNFQSTNLLNNFSCLQKTGKFCNEAAPGQ
ncbi:MAG TPA: hypothetical protein VKL40_08120 [Candidatus Angelobacter sp.]|nr:hypothetical protein [Candidatus Angelobacter sp.]